jgi:hypothetical protein
MVVVYVRWVDISVNTYVVGTLAAVALLIGRLLPLCLSVASMSWAFRYVR